VSSRDSDDSPARSRDIPGSDFRTGFDPDVSRIAVGVRDLDEVVRAALPNPSDRRRERRHRQEHLRTPVFDRSLEDDEKAVYLSVEKRRRAVLAVQFSVRISRDASPSRSGGFTPRITPERRPPRDHRRGDLRRRLGESKTHSSGNGS